MATQQENNRVIIKSLSDFPTPVAGVITLQDNYSYEINGSINIGTNTITLGVSNTIFGIDKSSDKLIYTGTSAMISATNQDLTIKFITIAAITAGGSVFSITAATTNNIQITDNIFGSCASIGTITGGNFLILDRNLFSNNTTGITIAGTCNYFTYSDNQHSVTAGTCLTTTATTFNTIYVTRNFFTVTSPATAMNINAGTVVNVGILKNNLCIGTGTYLTGITLLTPNWTISTNTTPLGQSSITSTLFSLPRAFERSWIRWRASNATISATGAGGSVIGTLAENNQADSSYTSFTQASTAAGTAAGMQSASFAELRTSHDPDFSCAITTGADITAIRYWIGFFTVAPTNVDDLAGSCVAFRFSTIAADGGWRPVVDNGTTQTLGTAIGTVAASTAYKLRFRIDSANSKINFSANGGVEQVVSAIPGLTTNMGIGVQTFNTVTGTKTFSFSRLDTIHN